MATERDPVCGMTVDDSSPFEASEGGHTYHFCSATCRTRFENDPSQYIGQRAGSQHGAHSERHEPPHTGSGVFTAPKFGSAGSGGAEYEQLPERHDDDRKHRM